MSEADSTAWTCIGASTALCALVSIDNILVSLRDSTYRTLIYACAASNTVITNYVSHNSIKFIVNNTCLSQLQGNYAAKIIIFGDSKYVFGKKVVYNHQN